MDLVPFLKDCQQLTAITSCYTAVHQPSQTHQGHVEQKMGNLACKQAFLLGQGVRAVKLDLGRDSGHLASLFSSRSIHEFGFLVKLLAQSCVDIFSINSTWVVHHQRGQLWYAYLYIKQNKCRKKIRCPERDLNPRHPDLMTGALTTQSYRGNHSGVSQILATKETSITIERKTSITSETSDRCWRHCGQFGSLVYAFAKTSWYQLTLKVLVPSEE